MQYGSYNPYGTADRRAYTGSMPRDGLYNYDPYRRWVQTRPGESVLACGCYLLCLGGASAQWRSASHAMAGRADETYRYSDYRGSVLTSNIN